MLLETIKCKDGQLFNLEFHQQRFEKARSELGFSNNFSLKNEIQIPTKCSTGLFRCRLLYADKIEKIEFLPHHYKKIQSLKLVYDDSIDYHLKYSKREKLIQLFERRENCDDILIVKNGLISDSFTANPVFFDGEKWWTSNTPLLPGTQRARLIAEGKLGICKITRHNISNFQKIGLINAMQNFDDMPIIDIRMVF